MSCISNLLNHIIIVTFLIALLCISFAQNFHHRLTKRELREVFGVSHHDDVPEYALISARRKQYDDGTTHLLFDAWNQNFHIELRPNLNLFSPHLISVIRDGNSSRENRGLPGRRKTDCHFHGKVLSHDNAPAAVSYCNNLLGALIMGDHFLLIQTVPKQLEHVQVKEQHIIYKREASVMLPLEQILEEHLEKLNEQSVTNEEFCDVSKSIDDDDDEKDGVITKAEADGATFNYSVPAEGQLDSLFIFPQLDPITLEIGLFLDSKLYEHFQREYIGDAEQHLVDFALALINNVHVLYQQSSMSPPLNIVIVRFELWKKQPAGLETLKHRNGQAQTLLNLFCRHQALINPGTDLTDPGHWDHGILLTGYDIYHTTTAVAGVAPVARMCDEIFACSLVEGMHLGRSFVLAHEMGHNMGMVHDGVQNRCSRNCCLMSAVNGAGKTTWSECSVREFNAFLLQLDESGHGNCLRDGSEGLIIYNHLNDGRLPGQRFTGDQQCSYFWGKGFEIEIPKGKSMDDICRILWCGNNGSTISTAHPALEGSWCGDDKFCIEGQCQYWPYGRAPAQVDGGWTEWSSREKRCPISQCQITGSIQIKSEMRTCSAPAPNNGGKKCVGSNQRGLICGMIESTCHGMTQLEYGNKLCTEIRNDLEKPDRQLTGLSFLHSKQPCKVWCHLTDSEMIRNKGQYPDGSPCGPDRYCVGGQCLHLMCNQKAVVKSQEDCPTNIDTNDQGWGQWSIWSDCSVSCGSNGIQQRQRTCLSEKCFDGVSTDYRSCGSELPPCWLPKEWSEWSDCSTTCGTGIQSRIQICTKAQNCSKTLMEQRECNKDNLCTTWSEWESWTSCSVTCGGGQRGRKRHCNGMNSCEGEGIQIESCKTIKECVQETWGDWLPCSVSCGTGFQLRERLCNGSLCPGGQKQARACNEKDCKVDGNVLYLWSNWNDWLPCTASCGEGIQIRVRKCIIGKCPKSESTIDQRRCVLSACPEWSSWSDWTDCLTCEREEVRRRERRCNRGLIRIDDDEHECLGAAKEKETCDISCDNDNGSADKNGRKLRRKALSNRSFEVSSIATSILNIWNEWQEWQQCSRSCGEGTRIRKRICRQGADCTGHGPAVDIQTCNDNLCSTSSDVKWSLWSDWSPCSSICGDGLQTRFRKCKALFVFLCNGISKEERPCSNVPCPASISNILTGTFPDTLAPKWSEWSDWSKCSCFTMNQYRRRFCQIMEPSLQGFCIGPILEKRTCTPDSCLPESGEWSSWSDWSLCSSKCGANGHEVRSRMCSNPVPSNRGSYCIGFSINQRSCSPNISCSGRPVDGAWTLWSEWSECSDPCFNGHRSRTRFCSNPFPSNGGLQCFGSDFEIISCSNTTLCPQSQDGVWTAWTSWSTCSATCGFAFKSRQRYCKVPIPGGMKKPCKGLPYITTMCKTVSCKDSVDGMWSQWSEWGSCIAGCNNGLKTRSRACTTPEPKNGGYPCFGRSFEAKECQSEMLKRNCPNAIENAHNIEIKNSVYNG